MLETQNRHQVQKRQWHKWSPEARGVFNNVLSTMKKNQGIFMHPKDTLRREVYWETTCWNAAWIAADEAMASYEPRP